MNAVKFPSALLFMTLLTMYSTVEAANVRLHGTLVSEACVLQPGSEDISIEFGAISDNYLYANKRTKAQAININLTTCDLSLGKTVRVTFNGIENQALRGLLAVDGSSQASGIAIGMETESGDLLPLNSRGVGRQLVNGMNTLTVFSYVQGEPDALARRVIGRGAFTAIATFTLEYQ